MRYLYFLLALAALLHHPAIAQVHPPALFSFVKNGRWGFFDSTGAVVVAPRFAQVQAFSEGLAAVREGGRYGYIDATGHVVLPPRHDYATPFHQGLAAVTQKKVSHLIDRTGHQMSQAPYQQLEWRPGFGRGGVWLAWLPPVQKPWRRGGYQVLNAQGRLLSPELLRKVGQLSNNRLVVQRMRWVVTPTDSSWQNQVGVLDGQGHLVVPFGRFGNVSVFGEGIAVAADIQVRDAPPARQYLIDTTGQVVVPLPPDQRALLADGVQPSYSDDFASYNCRPFAEGRLRVRIGRHGQPPTSDSCELAVIDRQAHLLFRYGSQAMHQLSPFRNGRAWLGSRHTWQDGRMWLCLPTAAGGLPDTALVGEPLQPNAWETGPLFTDGAELVELPHAVFAALDSTGRIIRQVAYQDFDFYISSHEYPPKQIGNILLFQTSDSTHRQGFWHWPTNTLVPPRFDAISDAGYQHGLLAVAENNRLGYLSPTGRYVWRADSASHGPLNVDYMRRSFYEVASAQRLPKYASSGGWYESKNKPNATGTLALGTHRLTLQVAPTASPNALQPALDGHRVMLANPTADTVVFDAQDSGLYLAVQARDARGRWRNIEYTPSSFCGNSYHRVFLAPGQYWQFTVPAYAGGRKTQLRLKLIRQRNNDPKQQVIVYSNTFAGSVNPAQFWRLQPYERAPGLMDPYTN